MDAPHLSCGLTMSRSIAPSMTTYEAELGRLNSPKQKLLSRFPRQAIYARYLKALFRGEVELRLLPILCRPSLVSLDVGAHHGIYTLGTSLFSRRTIAVEPQHHLAMALQKSLPARATLVEGALSSKPGSATLRIPLHEWDSISHLDSGRDDDKRWRSERVTLFRLDDIATERVGFVKIDVEGHEHDVLEGAARVIASDRPTFLIEIEERHRPGSVGNIVRFMSGHGYRCHFVRGDSIRPIQEFDLTRDQEPTLIGKGDRANYSDYINNFIFVPPEQSLPLSVPSPAQALFVSLARILDR